MNRNHIRLSSLGSGAGAEGQPGMHDQLELLISRIADGESAPSDWQTFAALAERVPDAWEQLAKAQRDHAALSVAVGVALHAADRVELPERSAIEAFASRFAGEEHAPHRIVFWSRVRSMGGWAAAAALTLAWLTGGLKGLPTGPSRPEISTASLVPQGHQVNTPDDAIKAYLDLGRTSNSVLGEVPQRIKIGAAPTADGKGVEVTYLRQFIEKVTVKDLVEFGSVDEAGRMAGRRVSPSPLPDAPQ